MLNNLSIVSSAIIAQSNRLNVSVSNIANSESIQDALGTPYKAKQVVFKVESLPGSIVGGVKVSNILEDKSPHKLIYSPNNPHANNEGYIKTSNVNKINEIVNILSASNSYKTNIEIFNNIKTLIMKTISIGQ